MAPAGLETSRSGSAASSGVNLLSLSGVKLGVVALDTDFCVEVTAAAVRLPTVRRFALILDPAPALANPAAAGVTRQED